jgi:intracellular sulfur oxidation DsrE/DsrF family protein
MVASIVVIHNDAIPLFAKGGRKSQPALASRAQDLAMGGMIQFRLCAASAKMQGYGRGDFEGFIELVPMAGCGDHPLAARRLRLSALRPTSDPKYSGPGFRRD